MTPRAVNSLKKAGARALVVGAGLALAAACSSGGGNGGKPGTSTSPLVCDVTLPTACTDMSIRYADVAPIFENRCIHCHSGDPAGPWPLNAYEHVADWANEIRGQMAACSMPPVDAGETMPTEERDEILLWIRCGAKQ